MSIVAPCWPLLVALAAPAGDCPMHAQHQVSPSDAPAAAPARSPYAGEERREIKALSAAEVEAYSEGAGMGLARPAELNGYPGPRHVLDAADALGLSDAQRQRVRQSFETMKAAAIPLGRQLIEAERRLDQLFAGRQASAPAVEALTREAAEIQGRLRAVHLRAHLDMVELLSPAQVERYMALRGYAPHQH